MLQSLGGSFIEELHCIYLLIHVILQVRSLALLKHTANLQQANLLCKHCSNHS
jgi:hypothetical protein